MPGGLFYYEETFFPMLVTLIVINKDQESAGQGAPDPGCLHPTRGHSQRGVVSRKILMWLRSLFHSNVFLKSFFTQSLCLS